MDTEIVLRFMKHSNFQKNEKCKLYYLTLTISSIRVYVEKVKYFYPYW